MADLDKPAIKALKRALERRVKPMDSQSPGRIVIKSIHRSGVRAVPHKAKNDFGSKI